MSNSKLILDLHTDFSGGRSGGLVLPSLEEFSTVCCDPHRQRLWFGVVNKANVDVFLESSCFFYDPKDVGNLISGSSAFPKSTLNTKKFSHQAFHTKKYLIMSNNTLNTGKEAKLKQKIQEDIKRLN